MYGTGHRRFIATNPPRAAQIYYSLSEKAEKASIKIIDYTGETVRELPANTEPGLHVVAWDMRAAGGPRGRPQTEPGSAGRGGGRRSRSAAATSQNSGATEPAANPNETAAQESSTPASENTPTEQAVEPTASTQASVTPATAATTQRRRGPGGPNRAIPAGMYRVVLTVDGKEYTQSLKIEGDLVFAGRSFGADESEEAIDAQIEIESEKPSSRAIIH
jgi:hypothetical protein